MGGSDAALYACTRASISQNDIDDQQAYY